MRKMDESDWDKWCANYNQIIKLREESWQMLSEDIDARGADPPEEQSPWHNMTNEEVLALLETKGHQWNEWGCERCGFYRRDLITYPFRECTKEPLVPEEYLLDFPGWDGIGD